MVSLVKKNPFFRQMTKIAFQGAMGANSDLACRAAFPSMETLPCHGFEEVFKAVREGRADLAMIPVDNTLAGRVADVHHLIPKGGLFIVAEHFEPIRMALVGLKEAKLSDIRHVSSHVHALPQCRKIIKKLKLETHAAADTARAAAAVAEGGDITHAAIATPLAAKIYGLKILQNDVQDSEDNTTRFLIWAREPHLPPADSKDPLITSFMFRVRNIPAALYKALGGFATNGVNITKLESYIGENFQVAQFLCDVEGHPERRPLQLALEELDFFAEEVRILGSYPAASFRRQKKNSGLPPSSSRRKQG
ncbi:MAG TPA: prephenate dehydratase [Micavibrio sp.]